MFQNRAYAHADYNPEAAWMYATSYRTGYSPGSWSSVVSQNWHTNMWGQAHEIGHINQVRPGMRWAGMVEVTVNIFSMYVQTSWGLRSRLEGDNVYSRAFAQLGGDVSHRELTNEPWSQLVPFWQLKLYLHDVLGKTDFYPDLHIHYMKTPTITTPATDGRFQLDFVRQACRVAELDLTEFFEAWGFLTPINRTVNDYGSSAFIITQAQINALKDEIAAKGYPKPPKDFTRITDSNKDTYK
jgi:hypothetical protein